MNIPSFRNNQTGDTIVEVLIAIVIASLMLTGAYVTTNTSLLATRDTQEHSEAKKLLEAQVEMLRASQTIQDDIFATTSDFCLYRSGGQVKIKTLTSDAPAKAADDPLNEYPAECINDLYHFAVRYNQAQGDLFSFRARWEAPGGHGKNEVTFFYRWHKQPSVTIIPPGTGPCTPVGPSLVYNGNFAISPGPGPGINPIAGYTSTIPNRGAGIYPDDEGLNGGIHLSGGFSIQTGNVTYFHDQVIRGYAFPGDTFMGVNVPANANYWYSNPNQTYPPNTFTEWNEFNPGGFSGMLWQQTVNGLTPNTKYVFVVYFDNLLPSNEPANADTADPHIQLRVNGSTLVDTVVPKSPNGDVWTPESTQFTTTAGQNSITLSVWDVTGTFKGDDFGMTSMNLFKCQ